MGENARIFHEYTKLLAKGSSTLVQSTQKLPCVIPLIKKVLMEEFTALRNSKSFTSDSPKAFMEVYASLAFFYAPKDAELINSIASRNPNISKEEALVLSSVQTGLFHRRMELFWEFHDFVNGLRGMQHSETPMIQDLIGCDHEASLHWEKIALRA